MNYSQHWDEYQYKLTEETLTKKNNFKAPSREDKVLWISKAWREILETTVEKGFKIYKKGTTESENLIEESNLNKYT